MEELVEQIQNLEMTVKELEEKSRNPNLFNLTSNEIIQMFYKIQPFSGENDYKLKPFLEIVKHVAVLCGENDELKTFCIQIIINHKIIGLAKDIILEIPKNQRTWSNIVEHLKIKFRPTNTIDNLLIQANQLKVRNLKDLFNKLTKIKTNCHEICDFNEENHLKYKYINRVLVELLITKVVPSIQSQIDSKKSLFELDSYFCQTDEYYNPNLIKNKYQLNNYQSQNYNDRHSNNYIQFNNIPEQYRNGPFECISGECQNNNEVNFYSQ